MPPSQTGVVPEQSALATQRTQVPEPTSHTGVAPRAQERVAERALAARAARLAGRRRAAALAVAAAGAAGQERGVADRRRPAAVGVGEAADAELAWPCCRPASRRQQWLLARHCTQVAIAVSQIGVDPPQSPMLVAEQAPQAPDAWQAGAVPGHCASEAQGWQACVPVLQTGVVPAAVRVGEAGHAEARRDAAEAERRGAAAVARLRALLDQHAGRRTRPRRRRCRRSGSPAGSEPDEPAAGDRRLVADRAQRRRVDRHAECDRRRDAGGQRCRPRRRSRPCPA